MKKLTLTILTLALTAPASAYDAPPGASETELRGLLSVEVSRPETAPAAGETVWDKFQTAVARLKAARAVLKESSGEKAAAAERLRRLEETYAAVVYPGTYQLSQAFVRTRFLNTFSAITCKEREIHALAATADFRPQEGSLAVLREHRQVSHEAAVKAEALLAEGAYRLGAVPDAAARGEAERAVAEAEKALLESVRAASVLAGRLRDALGPEGAYAAAVAAVDAFTPSAGGREPAVRAINHATENFVVLEYGLASTIEEVRTVYYLMGKLSTPGA